MNKTSKTRQERRLRRNELLGGLTLVMAILLACWLPGWVEPILLSVGL